MRENRGWYQEGLPHEQLVVGIKQYVRRFQQLDLELQGHLPPEKRRVLQAEAVIRRKLDWESGTPNQERGEFYTTLRNAWDALVYDRYTPGSHAESLAGSILSLYYSTDSPQPDVIRLADPVQVRVMDALAEAADVPHQHGQTEIVIPKKLKNYSELVLSEEYQSRIKAEAAKARGERPQKAYGQPPLLEHQQEAHLRGDATASKQVEQNHFYAAFWEKFIEQASTVPSREDPAFWPRRVFEKFEDQIAHREYLHDKAQHALAMRLAPMAESMRKIRTAYEITAYPHTRKAPWEKNTNSWQELIARDLRRERESTGRESVELTDAELAIVQRLCETPRYAIGRDGKRTLQPAIPFNPQQHIYNYADIIGPALKTPQRR